MAEKFKKEEKAENAEIGDNQNKNEVAKKGTLMEILGKLTTKVITKVEDFIDSSLLFTYSDEILYPNIAFYNNDIPFYPSGYTIDTILQKKNEDYRFLEESHTYIQWLFPNRNPGMNRFACVLTDYDTEVISKKPKLRARVRSAFEMMLGFYGMRLNEEDQFELTPNAQQRLFLLNRPFNHNFLRITRILLAIKELGHHKLMLPWMKFLADLIYKDDMLNFAASSLDNHWLETLDAEDEMKLKKHLDELKSIRDPVVIPTNTISPTTNTINDKSTNSSMSSTNTVSIDNTTSKSVR